MNENESNQSIQERHSKFYFLSRFLYETTEFYGSIMKNDKTVYHGLSKPFLFKKFSTHFNAPTSTSEDKQVAFNFTEGAGIILALKNGNKQSENDIISQFAPDQPRYLDVGWLSCYSNERELLFYGSNIIFQIVNIIHKEVGNNTLKRLILFQNIIKNKAIDWDNESNKRISGLAQQINTTRDNIIKLSTMNDEYKNDKYQHEINELKSKLSNKLSSDDFAKFALDQIETETFIQKKSKQNDTQRVIDAVKNYLFSTNMSGNDFLTFPRKEFLRLISKQNIQPVFARKVHGLIKKAITKHDSKILEIIENKERAEIEKFELPYYLKLYLYFVVSQSNYICIQCIQNLPQTIKNSLFITNSNNDYNYEEEEKYNNNNNELKHNNYSEHISFTKLTDLFINTEHIAFTNLPFAFMIKNCGLFCKSIILYSRNDKINKNKKLKTIVLESENVTNSKVSNTLKQCIEKYQSKTRNITVQYLFKYDEQHIIKFKITSIRSLHNSNDNDSIILNINQIDESSHSRSVSLSPFIDDCMDLLEEMNIESKEYIKPQDDVNSNINVNGRNIESKEYIKPSNKRHSVTESLSYLDQFMEILEEDNV